MSIRLKIKKQKLEENQKERWTFIHKGPIFLFAFCLRQTAVRTACCLAVLTFAFQLNARVASASTGVPVYAYEAPGAGNKTNFQNFLVNTLPHISGIGEGIQWVNVDNCSATAPCATEKDFNWSAIDQELMAYINNKTTSFNSGCAGRMPCKIILIFRPITDGGSATNDLTPKYVFSSQYAASLGSAPQDVMVCGNLTGGSDNYWTSAPPITGNFGQGQGVGIWNVSTGTILHGSGLTLGTFPTTNFSGFPVVYEKPFMTAYQNFIRNVIQHYSPGGSGSLIGQYIAYVRFGMAVGGENLPLCSMVGGLPQADWKANQPLPAGYITMPTVGNTGDYYFIANEPGTTGPTAPAWCQTAYCNTGTDGTIGSGWRNSGVQMSMMPKIPKISPANAMWPGPRGQAVEPNGFTDNGYQSTWNDADGAGYMASMDSFMASLKSLFAVTASAHNGPPVAEGLGYVNFAYAGAESIMAASNLIGFGPEGLNLDDPVQYAAEVPPTTLNDFAENFSVFENVPVVRYLQTTTTGFPLSAEQFTLSTITVNGGMAIANCSNGDCSIYCTRSNGHFGPVYISSAGASGLNGTQHTTAGCTANTVSYPTTVGDGTYPGGTVWGRAYLPIILPFGVQRHASAFELHECTLDYVYGTTTKTGCIGSPGPDLFQQAVIENTITGNTGGTGGNNVTLSTPTLSLPPYVAISAQITAGYSGNDPAAYYAWSFTPVSQIPSGSEVGSLGIIARAQSANWTSPSPQTNLGSEPLSLGPYQVSVQVYDSNNNASTPAQAYVTLVPSDLSGVRVFPNPWRSDKHGGLPITFDNLTVNTTIKIFTVSGHWIKTLPESSTSVTWDLTNDSGEKVASGLYVYLVMTDSGLKKTGQLAVIK